MCYDPSNRIDLVVYHGKVGGDLEGNTFRGDLVFFAPTGEIASTYAEHQCMNGSVDYGFSDRNDDAANDAAFLGANPVVYKARLSIERPAVLDAALVSKIAIELGVAVEKIERFVEDFNDALADERDAVFTWVKANGYDGAVLPLDQMPVCAGGDWDWYTSYVAFEPATQVRFALSEPDELVGSVQLESCEPVSLNLPLEIERPRP